MTFKPSSIRKLFFTYICPTFYGSPPSAPATTTSTQTINQSPWQNPIYQALMLGTADKPGPVTSLLRSSAEQTAAWNDMLKGGYSPVPMNPKYSGYSAPTYLPSSVDTSAGAGAAPTYTLPAATPAAPTGANAIVNGGAKGGIMSLQGYAQGRTTAKTTTPKPTAAEIEINRINTKIDKKGEGSLTENEKDTHRLANQVKSSDVPVTLVKVGTKVVAQPSPQGLNESNEDYTKRVLQPYVDQYGTKDLPKNIKTSFPNIKTTAETTASENLKNTIGTSITAPTAFWDPETGMSTLPDFLALQKTARDLDTPDQFGTATEATKSAIAGLMQNANFTPAQIKSAIMKAPANVSAEDYVAEQAQKNQMAGPKSWTDAGVSSQYMSPYMQNVVDIQKREADRDYQQQLNKLSAQAVHAGAFGGSRQGIERAEAARNQATRLGDIQAKGLQDAYASGMGQFTTEQGQTIDVGKANLSAEQETALANQNAINQQRALHVQQALDAAKTNYGGQLTAEQANQVAQNATNQFNVQSSLQANAQNTSALTAAGQTAQGLASIGTAQNTADIANMQAQAQVAQAEQALAQQGLQNQQQTAQNALNQTASANSASIAAINAQPVQGGTTVETVNAPKARGGLIRNNKLMRRGVK